MGRSAKDYLREERIREQKDSKVWYLYPIIFAAFGGFIGWYSLKNVYPKKALYVMIVGIVLTLIWVLFFVTVMYPYMQRTYGD
jgi:hypothetical protein